MSSQICGGLRVLDLSLSMSGALATMIMSDAGAEVIKIEPPSGDPTRRHYASYMWHRGKKSVTLDLKTPGGRESLHQLVAGSDILLHTFRPGVAGRLGAEYDSLLQLNPALVYCAISGFGPLECYQDIKGYDGIVAALTGRFHAFDNQIEKDGPIFSALPVASFGAAMLALQGTMAALYSREGTGRGQKVETSLLQALAIYDWDWLIWQFKQWGRDPNVGLPRTEPTPQYFVARTKDGRWLQMANAMNHLFVNWLVGIGLDDVLEDPRYIHLPFVEDKGAEDELYRRMFSRMEEKDLDEWMLLFMTDVDAASERFGHTLEAFNHPQVVHNGHAIELHDPQVGPSLQLGPLAMFTETPLKPRGPSPALGQHNAEILIGIKEITARRPKPSHHPMPKAPLHGVTILEFASWVAVPLGPSMLADMGARVIKVEPPGGDPWRGFGAMGLRTLQGKESVALDLKKPEGQRIARELIKRADIVAHNFRPGVPERLGITYETARALNPEIIYLYGAGYGSTGPYSHRSVMHPIPGAVAGGALYQAGRGTPPAPDAELTYEEVRRIAQALSIANEGNPDVTSAMVVASSLLMALYVRKKTGKGQYLETSMICSNLYANSDDFIQYQGKPPRLLPDAQLNGLHALYRIYPAKEGWVFLACTNGEEWRALCQSLRRADLLQDPRFATSETRLEHDDDLVSLLTSAFKAHPAGEWQEILTRQSVACVEVYPRDFSDFANTSTAMRQHGLMLEVEHPSVGEYLRYGPLIDFSDSPSPCLGPVTCVGEHTESVLRELGYSSGQVRDLEKAKVVVCNGEV